MPRKGQKSRRSWSRHKAPWGARFTRIPSGLYVTNPPKAKKVALIRNTFVPLQQALCRKGWAKWKGKWDSVGMCQEAQKAPRSGWWATIVRARNKAALLIAEEEAAGLRQVLLLGSLWSGQRAWNRQALQGAGRQLCPNPAPSARDSRGFWHFGCRLGLNSFSHGKCKARSLQT